MRSHSFASDGGSSNPAWCMAIVPSWTVRACQAWRWWGRRAGNASTSSAMRAAYIWGKDASTRPTPEASTRINGSVRILYIAYLSLMPGDAAVTTPYGMKMLGKFSDGRQRACVSDEIHPKRHRAQTITLPTCGVDGCPQMLQSKSPHRPHRETAIWKHATVSYRALPLRYHPDNLNRKPPDIGMTYLSRGDSLSLSGLPP